MPVAALNTLSAPLLLKEATSSPSLADDRKKIWLIRSDVLSLAARLTDRVCAGPPPSLYACVTLPLHCRDLGCQPLVTGLLSLLVFLVVTVVPRRADSDGLGSHGLV